MHLECLCSKRFSLFSPVSSSLCILPGLWYSEELPSSDNRVIKGIDWSKQGKKQKTITQAPFVFSRQIYFTLLDRCLKLERKMYPVSSARISYNTKYHESKPCDGVPRCQGDKFTRLWNCTPGFFFPYNLSLNKNVIICEEVISVQNIQKKCWCLLFSPRKTLGTQWHSELGFK